MYYYILYITTVTFLIYERLAPMLVIKKMTTTTSIHISKTKTSLYKINLLSADYY